MSRVILLALSALDLPIVGLASGIDFVFVTHATTARSAITLLSKVHKLRLT